MYFNKLEQIEARELLPGFHGRFIHTQSMTLAYWEIKAGSELPEHKHMHEQVANLLEGTFEITIAGKTRQLEAGDVAAIPPHVLHSGRALTDCRILDVFTPVREDYR